MQTKTKSTPIMVDQPEPGFFKLRLVSGGWHEVPCRIIREGALWSAEIDGTKAGDPNSEPVNAKGVLDIWHRKKTEITEAEYRFLTGKLKAWAREFYPDHPLLTPNKKMKTTALRPIPQFTAPPAPAPLSTETEEGRENNSPPSPKPLTPEQVSGWLDFDNEPLTGQIERDVRVLKADAEVVINDEATLQRIAANVDIGTARLRQAEKNRTEQKAPFLAAERAVDAWYKRWTQPLREAIAPLQRAMDAYGAKVDAERRAEAARKAEEARREAERLATRAVEQLQHDESSVAATVYLDEAAEAAKRADNAAALATGNSANLTRTTGAYGGVVSGQEVWGWEVEDISKVPVAFLQVNETLANKTVAAFAKASPDQARQGVSPIPGLRITRTISMRNR